MKKQYRLYVAVGRKDLVWLGMGDFTSAKDAVREGKRKLAKHEDGWVVVYKNYNLDHKALLSKTDSIWRDRG